METIIKLTSRELDILRLLPGSLTLKEIAAELYISHNTVKSHMNALYLKLEAHSRSEAITKARSFGLIA